MIPPILKIWGQTRQIPKLFAKKVTQYFFQNFFLTFNFASKHLKFYYTAQYSRFRSTNFESQCNHFWLEFLMILAFLESLHTTSIIRFYFQRNLISFTFLHTNCPKICKKSAIISKEWNETDCSKIEIFLKMFHVRIS